MASATATPPPPSSADSLQDEKKTESPSPAPPPAAQSKTPEPPKAEAAKENKDPKEGAAKPAAEPKKEEEKKETVTSPVPSEGGDRPETPKGAVSLREQFKAFSKFGDTKSDGKLLTLSQSDKWMKQAKVIDMKTISTTDTAITFKKFKQMKIGYADYEKYLDELAKYKKQDVAAIKEKMKNCGTPGTRGTTSVVKGKSVVDRLTNTQNYTGSHKQRFDAEGKGRGMSGRKEVPDKTGYVKGYKNKDSYDKTH